MTPHGSFYSERESERLIESDPEVRELWLLNKKNNIIRNSISAPPTDIC